MIDMHSLLLWTLLSFLPCLDSCLNLLHFLTILALCGVQRRRSGGFCAERCIGLAMGNHPLDR